MEISLRIEDGRGPDGPGPGRSPARYLADVVVRVEPGHSVRVVADAVAEVLGLDVGPGFPVSRVTAGGDGGWIDDRATVVEAGLVSGDALVVGEVRPCAAGLATAPRLVVTSGPDAGRSAPLSWGALSVGRDGGCDLVLTDPQVSRRHLEVEVVAGDGPGSAPATTLRVLAADRNEVRTDGSAVDQSERLRPEQVVRVGASTLAVRAGGRPVAPVQAGAAGAAPTDVFGQVPFHRTPYFPAPVREQVVEAITEIPTRPERARFAYLSALLPVLMGVSFAVLMGNARYLLFAAFSPIMVIGNWLDQRRRSGRDFARSIERFEAELTTKVEEIEGAMADERARRFAAAPDVAALAERARVRSADLWVRDRSAVDFLEVRVGVGDLPATVEVRQPDRGDVEFRDQVIEAYGPTDVLTDVPVTLPLAELGVVGLVGPGAETTRLVASLVLQAACLHSPEDLVIVSAAARGRGLDRWLKWLPHTRSTSSPLSVPHLVDDRRGADTLVAELATEAARRLDTSPPRRFPWILVVLDRTIEPDAALVSRLLDVGPEAGMSVVWTTDRAEWVPRQARSVVDCRPASTGALSRITATDPEVADRLIDPEQVGAELALDTARALAPVRDASSANAVTAIPRVVPLFTALGVSAIDPGQIIDRWKRDQGYALRGPIGHTETGPLMLDLVEHGPHGLIGGTSGAGKSELVMSLVAGLIAENPPDRVNFLFIDYKGGASSDLFRPAPHTVGYVTNLDGLLAMRALTSLRAELNRRMNLLQGRAKDLAEMIERHPDEAPPSLVIVVDEFATLVKEIPDFVAGMVDVAQRGRSLGIHLLLATQRPSGAVNDNIKANTNLRIALRMLDGSDSTSVIGSADAAAIPTPLRGRGYARLGAGELVAFQSAWSGAPLLAESGPPPVGVGPFEPGRSTAGDGIVAAGVGPGSAPSQTGGADTGRTQIDALLESVVEAAGMLGLERGRAPWLEVLPSVIPLDQVRARSIPSTANDAVTPGTRVVLGMVDDPEAQAQYPAVVDLARTGGLLVSGSGGSGKSTALITAAVSAAVDDSEGGGGQLTIFGIDVASRELLGLNRLPQCAAVATGDDLEAVTRIIDRLDREFERRREALAESVAASAAPPRETSVLLVIDGLEALLQTMEQGAGAAGLAPYLVALHRLLAEGRQVGIFPLVATPRSSTIRTAVASALGSRLVLRQSDPQGYTEVGLPAAQAKDLRLAAGQGFVNGGQLIQVASLAPADQPTTEEGGGSAEDQHRQRERARLSDLAATLTGRVDPRLATTALPRRVPLLARPTAPSAGADDAFRPVVGLADLTGRPHTLDLRHANLSVVGDPRSGRSTVLATIGHQLAGAGVEVWVVGGPGSPLVDLDVATRVCGAEGEERATFLEELAAEAERLPSPTAGGRRTVLLLDDHDLLPENDRSVTGPLERLLGVPAVRWVAAGAKPRGFSPSPVAQLVRGARSVVYLQPHDPREAHEVIGIPAPWHPGLPMVEGRGLVVVDRRATIVQFSDPSARSATTRAGAELGDHGSGRPR